MTTQAESILARLRKCLKGHHSKCKCPLCSAIRDLGALRDEMRSYGAGASFYDATGNEFIGARPLVKEWAERIGGDNA
jgi:hypothetical protein